MVLMRHLSGYWWWVKGRPEIEGSIASRVPEGAWRMHRDVEGLTRVGGRRRYELDLTEEERGLEGRVTMKVTVIVRAVGEGDLVTAVVYEDWHFGWETELARKIIRIDETERERGGDKSQKRINVVGSEGESRGETAKRIGSTRL